MIPFVLRRLWHAFLGVAVVVAATFVLLHAAPGDPVTASHPEATLTPEVRDALRKQYGLDQPLHVQFAAYVGRVVKGDLGNSSLRSGPVSDAILSALPNTLVLMGVAIVLSVLIGIVTGVVQAARRGSWVDRSLISTTLFFHSMPEFWLATLMFLIFAYWLPIFPTGGVVDVVMHSSMSPWEKLLDRAYHLALPALTLVLLTSAIVARYQRAAMLDALSSDFVRVAMAKGASRRSVLFRHALRNALAPTITICGLAFPALLGGAVFIESVYAWPGMGLLAFRAVAARDYSLILGLVIVSSVMVSLGGILADTLQAAADPRMRHGDRL